MDFSLPWCDKAAIKDNKIWFFGGSFNSLFCADIHSRTCRMVLDISCDFFEERKHTVSENVENKIFFFPVYGGNVKVFHQDDNSISTINIINSDEKMIVLDVHQINNKLYAVSRKLKNIYVIDIENERLIETIDLSEINMVGHCCTVEDSIFILDSANTDIYEINVLLKTKKTHSINCLFSRFFSISYCNDRFWLSGDKKAIYIWDKKTSNNECITNFPREFGVIKEDGEGEIYVDSNISEMTEPFFFKSIGFDNGVYFIPFRTNHILKINPQNYSVNIVHIEDENESKITWNRKMNHKYLVEYTRDDRYIGIYSLKNNYLFEIDSLNDSIQVLNIKYDDKTSKSLIRAHWILGNVLMESPSNSLKQYLEMVNGNSEK